MTMSGALKVVLLAGLVSFLDLETVVDSAGTDSLGVVGHGAVPLGVEFGKSSKPKGELQIPRLRSE